MPQDQNQDDEKLKELAHALQVYRDRLNQFQQQEEAILKEVMAHTQTSSLEEARSKIEHLMN